MTTPATAPAGTSGGSPPTRAHWVDVHLRREIVSGALAPGTRLRAEHLAETLGVSPTPLREAFQRLAGEGLVVIEPQRGARVAPIDKADALELYDLRVLLEPLAMRDSMAHTDAGRITEVRDAYERLAGGFDDLASALEAHRDFHLALLARCPNRRLLALIASLHDQSERYQAVGTITSPDQPLGDTHRALVDAFSSGDVETGVTTVESHLATARERIAAAVA
jgi:DNA-binding GntR family transcriptional regulator